MKFWTKVFILGAISFVALSVIGYFIARGVEDDYK